MWLKHELQAVPQPTTQANSSACLDTGVYNRKSSIGMSENNRETGPEEHLLTVINTSNGLDCANPMSQSST